MVSQKERSRIRYLAGRIAPTVVLLVAVILLSIPSVSLASATPSPVATLDPSKYKPPGVQSPWVGVLAVGTIVVVAAAGLWVYRVIRKGL